MNPAYHYFFIGKDEKWKRIVSSLLSMRKVADGREKQTAPRLGL